MDKVGVVRPTSSQGGIVKIDDQTVTTTTEEIIEEEGEEHPNRKPSSEAVIKMIEKIDIERIDITDLIVVIALSIALIYSIHMKMMELAMSIGSGLLGYIGGVTKRENQEKSSKRTDTMKTVTTSRPSAQQNVPEQTKPAGSAGDCERTDVRRIRELKDPNDSAK